MKQATDQEVIKYLWPHKRRVKKGSVMLRLGERMRTLLTAAVILCTAVIHIAVADNRPGLPRCELMLNHAL